MSFNIFILVLHLQLDIIYICFLDDILKYFKLYVIKSEKQDEPPLEDPVQEMIDETLGIGKQKRDVENKK